MILDAETARQILSDSAMPYADETLSEDRIIFPGVAGVGCFPTSILPHCVVVHAAVLPQARGRVAVDAGNAVCDWLAREYGLPVVTKTSVNNRPARVFAVLCGGKLAAKNEQYAYYKLRVTNEGD